MDIQSTVFNLRKVDPKLIPDYMRGRSGDPAQERVRTIDLHDAHLLPKATLEKLFKLAKEDCAEGQKFPGCTAIYGSISRVMKYLDQPDAANRVVSDLDGLLVGIKEAVDQTSPTRHWLYREMEDGEMVPAYLAEVVKKQRYGRDEPSRVILTLVSMARGKMSKHTVTLYRSDISSKLDAFESDDSVDTGNFDTVEVSAGIDDDEEATPKKAKAPKVKATLANILARRHLVFETEALYDGYKASIPEYFKRQNKCGAVVQARGAALYATRYKSWGDNSYNIKVLDIDMDDQSVDIVLDDTNVEKIPFKSTYSYWSFEHDAEYECPKFWSTKAVLPFQPYVLGFDLKKHQHCWLHANKISDRQYDSSILDKLVLPETDKEFLNVLMGSAGMKMEDIVKGKSGGIFVLSQGEPGTGKTLTAEIYSESMKKALYNVQCAQLGIDPEEIENRLKKVLDRAQRWGAILLLDEADVYIRKRDIDVRHNAIVGVMLRTIEYYSGLLFMTTNLDNVDDAILSRATAHIIYTAPGAAMLQDIWKVLSAQFKVELSPAHTKLLAGEWPKAVGRDVKNLLKLARLASPNSKATVETVKKVARYLDMEKKK
jgi:hypothetical protein